MKMTSQVIAEELILPFRTILMHHDEPCKLHSHYREWYDGSREDGQEKIIYLQKNNI